MARPPAKELTERELEVMQAFWRLGETGIAEVRDDLAARGRDLAYTTVATLVRILDEKGFLQQTRHERPFRYRPVRTFEEVSANLVKDLVQRVFDGSREQLLIRLMDQKNFPPRNEPSSKTSSRSSADDPASSDSLPVVRDSSLAGRPADHGGVHGHQTSRARCGFQCVADGSRPLRGSGGSGRESMAVMDAPPTADRPVPTNGIHRTDRAAPFN